MKIIFLDVDGVLNSNSFAESMFETEGVRVFHEDILDKRCIVRLKTIVSRTGAEIVLSSTWRRIPEAREHLCNQLAEFGLTIHSDTPCMGRKRGDDISEWFIRHRDLDIESYIILDDDSDMGIHMSHLVHTSFFEWGLEDKHIEPAVQILNNEREDEDA